MGNTFGKIFQISTWGESHGPAVGVTIDGCPAGVPIDGEAIQVELDRRRPGQSDITTPRSEADRLEVLSGVFEGISTGAPILLLVRTKDATPPAYAHLKYVHRPSHAASTYHPQFAPPHPCAVALSSAPHTIAPLAPDPIARPLLARPPRSTPVV